MADMKKVYDDLIIIYLYTVCNETKYTLLLFELTSIGIHMNINNFLLDTDLLKYSIVFLFPPLAIYR